MPNALINTDPLVARFFYLEIDGESLTLTGVSNLGMEMEVVQIAQNGKDGKQQIVQTLGGALKVPDITMTRMAPVEATNDPVWKWFLEIRDKGMTAENRDKVRKNASVVLYDSSAKELGRFNLFNAWPSKISTDALSTDSNDPMKETITFVAERIDRVK